MGHKLSDAQIEKIKKEQYVVEVQIAASINTFEDKQLIAVMRMFDNHPTEFVVVDSGNRSNYSDFDAAVKHYNEIETL